jgi:hypothetical protein
LLVCLDQVLEEVEVINQAAAWNDPLSQS